MKHVFKTSLQYIISLNAVLGQINQSKTIDFLDAPTANAIENFQDFARKKDYAIEIRPSLADANIMTIDNTTDYHRAKEQWAAAEFYFYGKITTMGGKESSSFRISTDDHGVLTIKTDKNFLERLEKNPLYKSYGIRASGAQNIETGEADKSNLLFLELIDYTAQYDEDYLTQLRTKAHERWLGAIDPTLGSGNMGRVWRIALFCSIRVSFCAFSIPPANFSQMQYVLSVFLGLNSFEIIIFFQWIKVRDSLWFSGTAD